MKIENNKLIAEFMGIDKCTDKACENDPCYYIDVYRKAHDLEYDLKWDWLMPVVEKIEGVNILSSVGMNVNIYNEITVIKCKWKGDIISIGKGKTRIQALYYAVIEFINWYNTQKVNQPSL